MLGLRAQQGTIMSDAGLTKFTVADFVRTLTGEIDAFVNVISG